MVSYRQTVYSYFICNFGTVKLLARGGGDSALNYYPRRIVTGGLTSLVA